MNNRSDIDKVAAKLSVEGLSQENYSRVKAEDILSETVAPVWCKKILANNEAEIIAKLHVAFFEFWEDNLKDKYFRLSAEKFKEQFSAWLFTKELSWLKYYGTQQTLSAFIGGRDGLHSVTYDHDKIRKFIGQSIWDHIDRIEVFTELIKARMKEDFDALGNFGEGFKVYFDSNQDISKFIPEFLSAKKDNPEIFFKMVGPKLYDFISKNF